MYVINGKFLTRKITGVDRFAREITAELDRIIAPGEVIIAVPHGTINLPEYRNILIEPCGRQDGTLWEQLDLPRFARKRGGMLFNPCNVAPLVQPGVVCIHDMNIRANPDYYDWKFVLWYRLLFAVSTRFSRQLVTISEFSRREIARYYPRATSKINVVPCSWQHIERAQPDESIFEKQPQLQRGAYFFAMSSMAKSKNYAWVLEVARQNPGHIFAVSGNANARVFGDVRLAWPDNVLQLGYVGDEEAVALMRHCRAFLFPTFYEGFGLPPLEAMACGADVVVSDSQVMREIFGECATYIDPHVPRLDIPAIRRFTEEEKRKVLSRFSWAESASILRKMLMIP